MRSLTFKLTLAFLFAGVIGVAIFALLTLPRTRSEFDQFMSAHDQTVLIGTLTDYYATHGNWEGVTQTLATSSILSTYSHGAILLDGADNVVIGPQEPGGKTNLPSTVINSGTPITVSGQTVGTVIFTPLNPQPRGAPGSSQAAPGVSPETAFIERVTTAALTSAGVTILIALVLGGILARTLTRPIVELTAATKAMAGGKLGQQVHVRSRDEVGTLAKSFNQMSADVARSSYLRKQMTADLAHDLRTPLSILSGYTEGLSEQRLQGTPALYTIMHDEVAHLQRLVEDLRTLSLADAGELSLNKRTVDPKALLERTGLAYIGQIEQRNLTLRVDAPEGLPSISVDTDRMTQVLNNLVSNALRYTEHGEIVLAAKQEDHSVCLQVSDTGRGIELEHLPFIFDRFYRADPSRQRGAGADDDSSGLGLAIAKSIVAAHGGTIAAESSPGHGSTFTLHLPLAD